MITRENIEKLREECMALSRQRKNEDAIACFDRILKIVPDDFLSLREKGILLTYLKGSDENTLEKAMKYLNRALQQRKNDYRTLRQKAEVISKLKHWDKAIEIYEELLRINNRDWKCYRGMGIAYADSGQAKKAIKCFDKAIELNNKDVISLRRKGVAQSSQGKDNDAIISFVRALSIPHRDCYNTLRDMGVSLRRTGRRIEAMMYFDQALKKNPSNGPTWKEKGILLSQLDRDEEAIHCFDKALQIDICDFDSWRQKAVSLFKLGRDEDALETLQKRDEQLRSCLHGKEEDYQKYREEALYHIKGKDYRTAEENYRTAERLIKKALGVKPEDALTHFVYAHFFEKKNLEKEAIREYTTFKEYVKTYQEDEFLNVVDKRIKSLGKVLQTKISDPVERVLNALETLSGGSEQLKKNIGDIEKDFRGFLLNKRTIPRNFPSFFVVLRKWNSYTPILPMKRGDYRGGGYFLHHRGYGIVIDPGFNFVENFYQEGFNIADIDAILITHAHPDHTADLMHLLTLIYERNEEIRDSEESKIGESEEEEQELKRIYLLFNLGANRKYSFLDTDRFEQIYPPIILDHSMGFVTFPPPPEQGVMEIAAVQADHPDILSPKTCLGYLIDLGDIGKIGLTGDTAWKVDKEELSSKNGNLEDCVPNIAQFFREQRPDIMVVHIGSVGSEEFKFTDKNTDEDKVGCFDKKHLGILGTSLFLNAVRPKIAIISEFGEELRDCRSEIAEALKDGLSLECCLAGDIGLYVQPYNLRVLTSYPQNRFVPYTDVACTLPRDGSTLCYHEKTENVQDLPESELKKLNEALEQKPKKHISERIEY